jgi:hypothetical protein
MTEFVPRMSWDVDNHVNILTKQDLDKTVDQLMEEANGSLPFSVEVSVNELTSLVITLGSEYSHVEFYSANSGPLVVGCRGPWDEDALIAFTHRGEYSEMELRYFVPMQAAREALRRYFESGERPDNIQWNDDIS